MDYYSDDHSIRISDLSGTAIFEIGADTGSNPGQFYNPTGVAVDYQSNIYCMDSGNNRIQIFNSAGTLQAYAGTAGSGNLQFNNGQGIAVDTGSGTVHTLYVCDQGNHRVQILSYNTVTKVITYVGVLTGRVFTSPASVIVGSTGKVFVTDSGANRVDEFSSGNAWVRAYTTPDSPATGSLSGPTGIVIDNNGKLVVCDTTNRRVVMITPL
jgi:sugar lactone lactonase YvrE